LACPGAGWDFKNLGEIKECTGLLQDLSLDASAWLQVVIGQSAVMMAIIESL